MRVYWLEPHRDAWTGWLVTWRPYREVRVRVPDVTQLPREARVYLGGERWSRS